MDTVVCKWERTTFPRSQFHTMDGLLVHVAAGAPLHTAAGRLYELGELDLAERAHDDRPDVDRG